MNIQDFVAGYLSQKTQNAWANRNTDNQTDSGIRGKVLATLKSRGLAACRPKDKAGTAKPGGIRWKPNTSKPVTANWSAADSAAFERLLSKIVDCTNSCS